VKIEGDSSRVPAADKFPVLKLNAARTFQTGIYPYSLMTSVFARLDQSLRPSKVTNSVQEWCGHTFHELVIHDETMTETRHSYFGGEGDQTKRHRLAKTTIFSDALPILLRELQGEWMKPGEIRGVIAIPSLMTLRLRHRPLDIESLEITKSASPTMLATKVGPLQARRWKVVSIAAGEVSYWIEEAWPRRILRWESRDETADIQGTTRLPYWELHKEGDEKYLKALGF
jgi:hypothetical protein